MLLLHEKLMDETRETPSTWWSPWL